MTGPLLSSRCIWCMRLLASMLAAWAIYRHVLRPDWSVRITIGSEVFDAYRRFWIWESPGASERGVVVGDVRWGHSLLSLAGNLLIAVGVWRLPLPAGDGLRHSNEPQQPTSGPAAPAADGQGH